MMTMSISVSQFNINFYADHHRLKIGLMNPSISLSDHLTHTQIKINLPTYYIETDGERLLTSDGRGSLPIIGSCSQEKGIIVFSTKSHDFPTQFYYSLIGAHIGNFAFLYKFPICALIRTFSSIKFNEKIELSIVQKSCENNPHQTAKTRKYKIRH